MAIGDSAGILFKIKSDYDDKGVKKAQADIGSFGDLVTGLGGPVGIATLGVTALSTAVVAVGAAAVSV